MKIIEAIKEFPLILKKMDANSSKIQEYASVLSIQDDLPFGTTEEQKKQVTALVQSNKDLGERYLSLARNLAYTNTQVKVEIGGVSRSITEWLSIRGVSKGEQISVRMKNTLSAQNTVEANKKLQVTRGLDLSERTLSITRLYDQKKVDEEVISLQDTLGQIDAKLEVVNATTDLLETK